MRDTPTRSAPTTPSNLTFPTSAPCKSGQILNCCHPNALMTLSEYLEDYASPETKEVGYRMVEKELNRIPKEKVRAIAEDNIKNIRNSNRRDFRF